MSYRKVCSCVRVNPSWLPIVFQEGSLRMKAFVCLRYSGLYINNSIYIFIYISKQYGLHRMSFIEVNSTYTTNSKRGDSPPNYWTFGKLRESQGYFLYSCAFTNGVKRTLYFDIELSRVYVSLWMEQLPCALVYYKYDATMCMILPRGRNMNVNDVWIRCDDSDKGNLEPFRTVGIWICRNYLYCFQAQGQDWFWQL